MAVSFAKPLTAAYAGPTRQGGDAASKGHT
jgi:hypothetical protein